MAKISVQQEVVKTIVEEAKVILELSVEEAAALTLIFNVIGGSPSCTPRKHISSIAAALPKTYTGCGMFDGEGSLYFSKNTDTHNAYINAVKAVKKMINDSM